MYQENTLLYLLADNKTKRHFRDLDEAIDDDSQAYCWRRSGFFWRMRASLDEVPASKRFQEKKTKSSARTRKWHPLAESKSAQPTRAVW